LNVFLDFSYFQSRDLVLEVICCNFHTTWEKRRAGFGKNTQQASRTTCQLIRKQKAAGELTSKQFFVPHPLHTYGIFWRALSRVLKITTKFSLAEHVRILQRHVQHALLPDPNYSTVFVLRSRVGAHIYPAFDANDN